MFFLQPLWLWALAALAIPVLIHLFNFRRPRRLAFSNLAFVRQVNREVVQRVRLKQWLLLLLRLLAIAALVLAFSGPVWSDEQGGPKGGNQSVVIVIDDSPSMQVGNEGGQFLQQARALAQEIIRQHDANDEFQVRFVSNLAGMAGFARRTAALQGLEQPLLPGARSLSLATLLRQESRLFQSATYAQRHLYVISDFQRQATFADSLKPTEIPQNLQLTLVPLPTRPQRNLYLSDLAFTDLVIQQGKPATLKARLHNDGPDPVPNATIRMEVEGEPAALQTVELEAGGTTDFEVSFQVKRTGWLSGKLWVEDQPNRFDNERYFTFYVPERPQVLLVMGAKPLPYLNTFYTRVATEFQARVLPQEQLAGVDLKQYRVVVLAGVSQLSEGVAQRLADWVRQGGGLLTFAGPEATALNNLYATLQAGRFQNWVTSPQPVTVKEPPLDHPLFAEMFRRDARAKVDLPVLKAYQRFTPGGGIETTLLQTQSGEILLQEAEADKGRILTCTTLPDPVYTDLPVRTLFAPLVYQATLRLGNTAQARFGLDVNAPQPLAIRTLGEKTVKLIPEAGDRGEIVPEQYAQAGFRQLNFSSSPVQAGVYRVVAGDSLLEKVAFNLPEAESQLAPPADFAPALQAIGLGDMPVQLLAGKLDLVRQQVQQNRAGIPLWKYFVLLAALCLLGEVVINRWMK